MIPCLTTGLFSQFSVASRRAEGTHSDAFCVRLPNVGFYACIGRMGTSPTRLRSEQFLGVCLRATQLLPKGAYLNNRDVQIILACLRKSFLYSVSKGAFHGIKNRTLP